MLGIGMAISVAPLTTAVMDSVPSKDAGVTSGVNNAISRIAGLLAVAIFGLILSAGFNRALSRSMAQMPLTSAMRQTADIQRSRLAGAEISDTRLKHQFDEAFVSGYRDVIWFCIGLALLSSLSAQMIASKSRPLKSNH
jgi:MFS family permease